MRNTLLRADRLSRSALLVLSLLSGCAANDFGMDADGRTSRFQPTGAIANYLEGRFAAQESDLDKAAEKLTLAARESGLQSVAEQAFIASLLAGRSDAPGLAAGLPNNPVAQLVLADQAVKAGRWDEAQARFSGLPQQGITQVLKPLLTAWAEQGAGRTSAAIGRLQPYFENGQLRAVMTLHAALIADLGGQTGDAARLYQMAQVDYGGLNLRLGVVLASWQARSGYVTEAQRIVAEITAGELSMARPALERSVQRRVVGSAQDGLAETYLAMGATLRQQRATDTALILLRLALDMRPDLTPARLLMSDIQDGARRTGSALATLQAVPADDPLITVVQLREAGLFDKLGRTQAATDLLEGLARSFPDQPDPLAAEADILRRKGQFGQAVTLYDRAVARLGTPRASSWPLFYERGVAYERSGDWAKAQADFEYALRLSPDQPAVLNYLGYAWAERNTNLVQAREMIQRAVNLRPDDAAFIDSLGWVMLQQGDSAGALKNLMRAVELQSEDPVINGHLGDALAGVGRWREAEFQWRRALTLKPDQADADRISARLASLPAGATTRLASPAVPPQ